MLVYIDSPKAFSEVLVKQIIPYYQSQEKPLFGLDLESFSFYNELKDIKHEVFDIYNKKNDRFELYKIPRPIKVPSRQVSRLWDRKEFTLEYESYSALFQLGANPRVYDQQWVFDVKKLGEELISEGLKPLLEDAYIVGHNLKYECFFLPLQFDIWPNPKKLRDTMIIEQIILAGTKDRVGLGDCYKRNLDYGFFVAETGKSFNDYLDHKESMQESDWAGDLSETQLEYAGHDVKYPLYLYEKQQEKLKRFVDKNPRSTVGDIIKFECEGIIEDALIELRGIDFDEEYHFKEVIPYLEEKKEESYQEALALCPNVNPVLMKGRAKAKYEWQAPPNFNSCKQIPKILAKLGVKVPNAQEDTLKKVRSQHPAVQAILNYKKCTTLLGGFGYKLPRFVHEDGRIHAEFRRIGTETGRFSSKNPNLYQIPKKGKIFKTMSPAQLFRRIFIAGKKRKFINSDYSTIEPRYLAQRSKDPTLAKVFNDNIDYYGFSVKNMLKLDEIPTKGSYMREVVGKTGCLAMQYLAGDPKTAEFMLVETLDEENPVLWTPQDAKEAKEGFFGGIPKVRELIDKTRREVWDHFNHFQSLAEFKNRRPIFVAFTDDAVHPDYKGKFRRHRSWFLTEKQEELAKFKSVGDPREHPLHKNYVVWEEEEYEDPKTGEKLTRLKRSDYNAFRRIQSEMIRELYNFRVQAPAALILKNAMQKLDYRMLIKNGFDPFEDGIILTIYDEVIARCSEDKAERMQELVQQAMIEAGEAFINVCKIKTEPVITDSWYTA